MFRIEFLAARHGDCVWIEYGDPAHPHRILIDGGPAFAYQALRRRVNRLPRGQRRIDLLIATHIDGDHIEGIIKLLRDRELQLSVSDIWYNGLHQLSGAATSGQRLAQQSYGVVQGEYLSALIRARNIAWNRPFNGGPVMAAPGPLPPLVLPGEASAVILSPAAPQLRRLRLNWDQELLRAGLAPDSTEADMQRLAAIRRLAVPSFASGAALDVEALAAQPFSADRAPANGSSIGLLLEYGAIRCLLPGDAHPQVIEAALKRLPGMRQQARLPLDLVKLPHHGSRGNISPALLHRLCCQRYIISSDGSYFNHPDAEAIARVIVHAPRPLELLFNYRCARTAPWDQPELKARYDFSTRYPEQADAGISIEFTP
ncbi:metallo-beta-lactamase superfamily protein [Janthinobacterium agaricidamnosum NBRC 102515 = DSM 9628]|uniref:Metallo-beta-lactamase superfamily protein n=2 Tax=Janthinobacterium agaricidamnosum TaxID=55508 RepID=W0V1V7_9BURK|nr:metallo-beta-lactamase superfamily protein [Janthinobacterium agaricidamnosum NBRC 102515 = DSM 9628]